MGDTFRLRPRFAGLALLASSLGAVCLSWGLYASATPGLIAGVIGLSLGALHLASPVRRMRIVVGEESISALSGSRRLFELPWDEVKELITAPAHKTCFLNGGSPECSLLVPGDGADAPYDIEDKSRLFELILERVDPARVVEVEALDAEPDQ